MDKILITNSYDDSIEESAKPERVSLRIDLVAVLIAERLSSEVKN